MDEKPILSAKDLELKFTLRGKVMTALRGISLDVYKGESLAIVGESGSGKSVFTKAFMGLTDANGAITGGELWYKDQDLLALKTEAQWRKIRGDRKSVV